MSIYGNLEFIDKHYHPTDKDVILDYVVTPKRGTSIYRAAEYIAGESSIGTWTRIQTMNPVIAKTLRPHVFFTSEKSGEVRIAYPELLFEPGNMPGLLSSIAGNIYGMKELLKLRLEDIELTQKLVLSFKGPQFGIRGVRRIAKVKQRPLLGTIVKPKVGLTSKQHAAVAYEAWRGGLDIVKDDENLCSMSFNSFEQRIRLTLQARDKAQRETGEKKIYLANITAETEEMKRRALIVKKHGGEYVMIDILTVGWAALQTMRDFCQRHKLAIHAHRAMHGALTRDHKHGISMLVIAKIARLIGVDQLHIGTANVGKMEGEPDEVLAIEEEIERAEMDADKVHHILYQDWHGLKPVMAVASGGLSPLSIPKLTKMMGPEVILQFGGGCHGHPDGTYAGAKAIRQAMEATMEGISLSRHAASNPELARALEKWGEQPKRSKKKAKPVRTTKGKKASFKKEGAKRPKRKKSVKKARQRTALKRVPRPKK